MYEIETSVDELRGYLLGEMDGQVQVALSDAPGGGTRMTLHLPASTRSRWPAMRSRLRQHELLGYLLTTRLLQLRFRVQQPGAGRKAAPLIDRRRRDLSDGG
jgi:hypothetical protein